jgi:riboflavin kinase/FMN adenylyltransferase
METYRTFEELAKHSQKVCLAIGVFDGVHFGHQRVIGQARDDARRLGGTSVALTFDPHPLRVLRPEQAPLLLTSTKHKMQLIGQLGVDACLLLTFDKEFSLTPPEQFIEMVAHKTNQLQVICVGTRFRFGHDRAGDVRLIENLAPAHGFIAREIEPVKLGDDIISSSAVRQHVLTGNLERAAAMLGRSFSVLGSVEKGDHLGHRIGYPTANLNPHNEVMPPNGVYGVRVRVDQETFGGVVNIGVRPTIENRPHRRVLEVHIFDFHHDIYGQDVEVSFVKKLRDEKKFDSVDALKEQIAADVQAARALPG